MRNIVVIGGGFAGTTVVKSLELTMPADWQIILVSEENYMTYTPLLPEVAGASLLPGHAVAPIRKMLRRARYYRAQIQDIDLVGRTVRFENGKPDKISYEHLIIACGKVPNTRFIEGMADNALPLKTLGDALHIRNRIIISLERAELENDPDIRCKLMTFIVIGGGSSGVEVAGEIADFLDAAKKYYPCMHNNPVRIVLLESGSRLLSEFPAPLGESALHIMRKNGIEIHLNTRATLVTKDGVRISGGNWIKGTNIICTIGTVPNRLIQKLPLPKEKGLIKTLPDMSVANFEGLWAIGDCAAVLNTQDGEYCPPTAQFAIRQGKQLAQNIVQVISGKDTQPFSYRSRGQLATIGHRKAVAYVLGIKFSGFPAWLLWRAAYLLMLPTSLRKLQVFSEWNLELLFPRDVTQLHLTRTKPPRDGMDRYEEQRREPKIKSAVSR
jgi:NADH dehydrogenase